MADRDGPISTLRRRGAQSLAAVVVVAAAAALLGIVRRPPTAASSSGPHSSAGVILAGAQTSGRNAGAAAQATIWVRVAPDHAKIFLDEAPLEGNPANLTLPRDGRSHRVRAEAPGYLHRSELVVVDRDTVNVELILDDVDDEVDPFGNKLTWLILRSVPPSAHLYLDNVLLPTNPSKAKYPRDGKLHAVRAAGPGLIEKNYFITFDQPRVVVELALERAPHFAPDMRESRRLRE